MDRSGRICAVDPVIDWCITEGRFIEMPTDFVEGLAGRLIDAGAPVWRIRVSFRTLHPQVTAWSYLWCRGQGCEEMRVSHDIVNSDMFIGSPIQYVNESGQAFRRNLAVLDPEKDHKLLFELREAGGSDYLALPLVFSDRQVSSLFVGAINADVESRGFHAMKGIDVEQEVFVLK